MGIFKKIKDIFYDEEIVEVPIEEKKEKKIEEKPIIEEISSSPTPTRVFKEPEEKKRTDYFSERELFKVEKTFDFPVFEEEEEAPRTRSKTNVLELEQKSISSRLEDPLKKDEAKSTKFKPSPVISPIYGILDKNYKKDQVIEKKEPPVKPHVNEINYDYVRRKAYGTLEDELEDTLTRVNSEISESVDELEKEIDNLPKSSKNIEKLLGEIEKNASISIGELEEIAKDEMMEDEEVIDKEDVVIEKLEEANVDNTLEHDLFNLIDSMYEEREE